MNNKLANLFEDAKKFQISLTSGQLNKFKLFEEFLVEYNKHTNLVSNNDINLIYEKHFVDSLAFGKFIEQNSRKKIIDIGSGGGFPVIPMAIVLENCEIIAVDSTKKKTDFINQAAQHLGLKNLTALNVRAEDLAQDKNYREQFDISTARAVGHLRQISELCIPFLKINGEFLAYKSAKVQDEISDAQNALNILNADIKEIFKYNIALDENFERNIVLIKKINKTPEIYPRSYSTIKNKPL